jgi:oligoendopeptidase F
MVKMKGGFMIFFSTLFLINSGLNSQTREKSDVPVEYTWNLSDLYPNDKMWNQEKEKIIAQFDQILEYKGKLSTSASQLLGCLEFDSRLSKEFIRLYVYAAMRSDENTLDSKTMAMKEEMSQYATNYNTKASFIEPEIVKMDEATIDRFLTEEPGLEPYKMYLLDIQRRKAHKLTEKEEKIIAEVGLISDGPSSIYNIFSNAELPYPEIELSNGKTVKIDQAGYRFYRAAPLRKDRKKVFQAYWKLFNNFKRTFGAQLYSKVKKDIFYTHVRNYQSSLHNALDIFNIPVEVYLSLINNVNDNLDSFHRYLKLRKRLLHVDTLKYYDIYAPVVKNVDLQYSYDEAKKLVLDAMTPLGNEYTTIVENSFQDRWIDVYPTTGKRSGAYSNGVAYDVHPYILLNFNGKFNDVSTLAHELGHTVHSYFSNKIQPYPTSRYSTFVAEVASTFNEALLISKMLKEIKDDDIKLSLLMEYLDSIKGTVFRQAQFAEFELRIHEKAENNEPLTGDVFTEIYGNILTKYYGHDKGVCYIDKLYNVEWAYILHFFHYNFYVYQYATSFTASTALAEMVLSSEEGIRDKYIQFLSSGGSDYPISLLKNAGVDMTKSEPFDNTIRVMNRTMDEIEAILERQGI